MFRKFINLFLIAALTLSTFSSSFTGTAFAAGEKSTYAFNETSGTTLQDSTGTNNGTLINSPTWTPSGKYDGALQFDGSNDYVDFGNFDITGNAMTITTWVKFDDFAFENDQRIISKANGVNEDDHYWMLGHSWGDTNQRLRLRLKTGGNTTTLVASSGNLEVGTWYHAAAIYDGSTMKLFLNAAEVGSAPKSGSITTSSSVDVNIGRNPSGGNNLDGTLDNLRIYERALTLSELQADMNTPIGSVTPPPDDNVPPTVSLTAPANNTTVSGNVTISANASDNVALSGVTFKVDGQIVGSEDLSSPYSIQWDSTTTQNGQHSIIAQARDTSGNTTDSTPITVTSSNTNLNDFVNETVVGNLNFVTTMEFLPDGKILLGEVEGTIRVVPAGGNTPNATPFLDIPNSTAFGDAGLLSITIDPNFNTNNYFYVFYAHTSGKDRLSRFTASPGWNTVATNTETVLWEDTNSTNGLHHGSGIVFGNDGKIYFSTGDGGNPQDSQSLSSTHGKLMRINPDGTIPSDNPFVDGAGSNRDEIWARGLRNPFRLHVDSVTGKLFIGDVGGNDAGTAWEEINVGVAGANYGWPICEGNCSNQGITSPVYTYAHNGRDASIVGGFVYRGTQFPEEFRGSYFFGDYAQNWIKRFTMNANGTFNALYPFEPEDGSVDSNTVGDIVEMKQGLDGALYYLDLNYTQDQNFDSGGLRRIRYIGGGNQPPVANASANPLIGTPPLTVNFSSAGSIDPEGTTLTYLWDFGDGNSSTSASPTHIYQNSGEYEATLTVSDGTDTGVDSVDITVGNAPTAVIDNPLDDSLFRAGDQISISGDGNDAEDGVLPASAFAWSILFHHEGHVHPVTTSNGVKNLNFNIPTTGHDFAGFTRYEIVLKVTDSNGLEDIESVFIFPEKVDVTVNTVPAGLTVKLDGINKVTPFVHDTLVGFNHTLEAPDQTQSGTSYEFNSWSNGGTQAQTLIVPATNTTLTATFDEAAPPAIPNLFAHWKLDEISGTTASDTSGSGFNGTLVNGPLWTGNGQLNNALVFDGSNDYINVGNFNVAGNQMTMSAWVKFSSLPSDIDQRIISKANSASESGHYWMLGQAYSGSNARLRFRLRTGSSTKTLVASSGNLSLNTWYHVAAVYNGSTMKLYLNGAEVGSTSKTGNIATSNSVNVNLGRNPGGAGNNFAGTMDDARIYNRALTPQELALVMSGN